MWIMFVSSHKFTIYFLQVKAMLVVRLTRHARKTASSEIISICVIRHLYSSTLAQGANIKSKVIYPNKHANHNKSLSATQMQLYRDKINEIQTYLNNHSIAPGSKIDLSVILGINSSFHDKQWDELKKWLHKMPNIAVTNGNDDKLIISKDYHIESIDFVSNKYPMITWKNHLQFKCHSKDKRNFDNTTHRIKELTNYYQLHSVFKHHSIESKMIIARGLNTQLNKAYNKLIDNDMQSLDMNDLHHLLGNLGVNILSFCNKILCKDKENLIHLHHDFINKQISTIEDIASKYNEHLDLIKYEKLCRFLLDYYPNYFSNANGKEYENVIHGATQTMSHLDVMPFLFEMKTLVKIGKLLDYINAYNDRLIHANAKEDRYWFDIHDKQKKQPKSNENIKIFDKDYRVYSERQLENGDCSFSVDYCTPDIVLSHPIWINNKIVYWLDAKCTKGANCLYDQKRRYQMYRFTKNYGAGAILALGSADLSIVGISDVIILDASHYL